MAENQLICPKCGSNNINVQVVTITKSKRNVAGGFINMILFGWWHFMMEILKWIFLTVPMFFVSILGLRHKKQKQDKIVTKVKKQAICQNCRHSWNV